MNKCSKQSDKFFITDVEG